MILSRCIESPGLKTKDFCMISSCADWWRWYHNDNPAVQLWHPFSTSVLIVEQKFHYLPPQFGRFTVTHTVWTLVVPFLDALHATSALKEKPIFGCLRESRYHPWRYRTPPTTWQPSTDCDTLGALHLRLPPCPRAYWISYLLGLYRCGRHREISNTKGFSEDSDYTRDPLYRVCLIQGNRR